MRFDLWKLITAVYVYEVRFQGKRTTRWECQQCGSVNPWSEWLCLYCRARHIEMSEYTLDTGGLMPDVNLYRPRSILKDAVEKWIQRRKKEGKPVYDSKIEKYSASRRLNILAAETYVTNMHESQGEPRRERDEDLDMFWAMLDDMDESGETEKLLAKVWKKFPDDAEKMGLPLTTRLEGKNPRTRESSRSRHDADPSVSDTSSRPQIDEDGPIPRGFRWQGKETKGLSGIPWKLVNYLWRRSPDGCTFDDLAEHVWGDSQRDGESVKQKFRGPQNTANRFFSDAAMPWRVSADTKPHLKQKAE